MDERVALGTTPPAGVAGAGRYAPAVQRRLSDRRRLLAGALGQLAMQCGQIAEVAGRLIDTLRAGRKVLVAGNGGSASEAQHFAAELVGRFQRERAPYAVLALTTDSAILTAVANDYGYRQVFARQVLGLGRPGDLLLVFSTSGRSDNLLEAVSAARRIGVTTVALTGARPSPLAELADLTLRVPATETALTQELHLLLSHLLCDIVETELSAGAGGRD